MTSTLHKTALDFLARREHSQQELSQKLKRHTDDAQEIERVLNLLTEQKLQSDIRFAESFIRHRVKQGYGWQKIRAELQQRGVSDADYLQALGKLDIQWQSVAEAAYAKRYGDTPVQDYQDKQKRMAFLQRRGFGFDEIYAILPR